MFLRIERPKARVRSQLGVYVGVLLQSVLLVLHQPLFQDL